MKNEKNIMNCCDILFQIQILEEVKQLLLSQTAFVNYIDHNGLCHYFKIVYDKYNITGSGVEGFTVENAELLAEKYNFPKPQGFIYWWCESDIWNSARVSFIDALICELKLKSDLQFGKSKSAPLKFKEHNLDVYYNPEYHGFHVIHKYHGDTVTIGACCDFYDDAYTCISRYTVKKSYLDKLIKLNKQILHTYPFIENYKFPKLSFEIKDHYSLRVSKNKPERSYLFFKDEAVITRSHN